MQTDTQDKSTDHHSAEDANSNQTQIHQHLQPMQPKEEGIMSEMDDDDHSIAPEDEVDIHGDADGMHVRSVYMKGERFVPWELPGRCNKCGSQNTDIHNALQDWGILIITSRLKKPVFIPFDKPIYEQLGNPFTSIRLRYRHQTMTISPAPKCNHDQNSADSATKKDEEKEPKNEMHVIIEGDEPKGDVEGGIQQKSSSPVADAKNPEPIPDANGNIDAAFIRIPYEYPFVPAYNGDAKSTGKLPEPSAEEEKPAEPPASPEKNAAENKENYDYDADSEALTKMLLEAIGTEDVGGRLADQLVKENDLQKNANGEGEEKGEKEMKMDAEKNDDDLINLQ